MAGLLAVLNGVGVVILLMRREWLGAAMGLFAVVGLYWFAVGAWLRTPWGHVADRTPPPGPPSLTAARARAYVAIGGVCVIACLIALSAQVIAGIW